MMRRLFRATWWWLVPFALVGAGCSGGDDDDSSNPSSPSPTGQSPTPAQTPTGDDDATQGDDDDTSTPPSSSITITSPTGGDVPWPFGVTVDVQNFTLDADAVGGENVEGAGHWHLLVDGEYNNFSATTTMTVNADVTPGSHTLQAQLVNNDHSDVEPAVVSNVVNIVVPDPTISITSPSSGEVDGGSALDVTVDIQNFVVLEPDGDPSPEDNHAGQGHWHLNIDGDYYQYSSGSSITIAADTLTPGTHTLTAQLVNNDHTALEPAVTSSVTVSVPDQTPTISILSPEDGDVGLPFTVSVDVDNFVLDPDNIGGELQDGYGHWHLMVDGEYYKYSGEETMIVDSLTAGQHTLQAVLVDNQHQELPVQNASDVVVVEVGEPSITITYPTGGQVASTFTVIVEVENFTLIPVMAAPTDEDNRDGQGHYHLFIDGQYYAATADKAFTVHDVSMGAHTITAELVQNDHSPFNPPITSNSVSVTVADQAAITITSPTSGDVDFPLTVTVDAQNFTFDPDAVGSSANEIGVGHWHLYVDGAYYNFSATNTMAVDILSGGTHTLQAELVNNDHTSLSPAVVSNVVSVNVEPDIEITSPKDGSTVTGSVTLSVAVEDFILDADHVGGDDEPGYGHYHVYVDDEYKGAGTSTTFPLGNLSPGPHQIEVQLAGNDHNELEPLVNDIVEITVEQEAETPPPSISIVSPTDYQTLESSSTEIAVSVDNFILDAEAVGESNEEGHGHYHVFVDGEYQSYQAGLTADVTALTPGLHEIRVELVNNDHSSLDPAVTDSVLVTVSDDAKQVYIVDPAEGAELEHTSVTLTVEVENFELNADAVGGTNVEGEGHYHLYLDGEYYNFFASSTATVSDLSEGPHTIEVELVNNDHTALNPKVIDLLNVTVLEGATEETLYDRLGGEEGISLVVADMLGRVAADDKINGYFLNSLVDLERIDACLVKQIGALTGGPQVYPDPEGTPDGCRDMKTTHEGLGISNQDYLDLAGHLVDALTYYHVGQEDIDTIASVLLDDSFKSDIVEDPTNDATIYQRVGRKPAIEVVIDDFVTRVVSDSNINGYFLNNTLNAERLGTCLVNQVCSLDGPCKYGYELEGDFFPELYRGDTFETCKDMSLTHAGLGISAADFDDLVVHLVDALTAAEVDPDDIDAIGGILLGLEDDIVEDPDSNLTVYQRVGRKPAIELVVEDLITRVVNDTSLVGFFASTDAERLDTCLVSQVCGIDGPCEYGKEAVLGGDPCRDMKPTHSGVTDSNDGSVITIDDFNALVGHLVESMNDYEVATSDQEAILGALGPLCTDIVADPSTCE